MVRGTNQAMKLVSRTFHRLAAAAALLVVLSVGTCAELAGLSVGEKAPAFSLKNQSGEDIGSAELLKKGPLAIVFYRSADW